MQTAVTLLDSGDERSNCVQKCPQDCVKEPVHPQLWPACKHCESYFFVYVVNSLLSWPGTPTSHSARLIAARFQHLRCELMKTKALQAQSWSQIFAQDSTDCISATEPISTPPCPA